MIPDWFVTIWENEKQRSRSSYLPETCGRRPCEFHLNQKVETEVTDEPDYYVKEVCENCSQAEVCWTEPVVQKKTQSLPGEDTCPAEAKQKGGRNPACNKHITELLAKPKALARPPRLWELLGCLKLLEPPGQPRPPSPPWLWRALAPTRPTRWPQPPGPPPHFPLAITLLPFI